jgi:GntR family transcriptional regulator/MocR family aminotransferase
MTTIALYWITRVVQFPRMYWTTSRTPDLMPSSKWSDLYGWQVNRQTATPLARQIYLQVRGAVLSGALQPDTDLPSTRAMAATLGVARGSVVAAYEQLAAEGIVECRQGSSTRVSTELSDIVGMARRHTAWRKAKPRQPPAQTNAVVGFERAAAFAEARPFNTGRTLIDARTREAWRKLTQQASFSLGAADLGYGDPCGCVELRSSICEYLKAARAVRCEPEQIIITAGTQHAIDITIRILLSPGDEVWVEDPGYPLTYAQLLSAKTRPMAIPVDRQGLLVDKGLRLAPKARAAFVTPSHQFPTGVVLSMARRMELLEWARRVGAHVIEDDYTSEFRYSGPPLASMQGLDEDGRVIYVGTLNKALFPGLRMGYVVVPLALVASFTDARYLLDRQPSSLYQRVIAGFMEQGDFAGHIRRMRHMYREQRDSLAETLLRYAGKQLEIEVPDQGMHLVAYFKGKQSDLKIETAAARAGIVVRAISRFYRWAPPRAGLMLGFSGFPRAEIAPAAARLGRLIARA